MFRCNVILSDRETFNMCSLNTPPISFFKTTVNAPSNKNLVYNKFNDFRSFLFLHQHLQVEKLLSQQNKQKDKVQNKD